MNGIFLVNKPQGMTSFDVIAILRRKLNIRRIGHTGTLDPNATGLMMVLVGKATKLLPFIVDQGKTYEALLKLGIRTDTGDIWGKVLEEKPVRSFDQSELNAVLDGFVGESEQVPPMYSALSVNGKRLYEYARENIEIERKPRKITITSLEGKLTSDGIRFTVSCSSGTYVRTLCEDIASKLDTVGTMAALVRTRIEGFDLEASNTLDEINPEHIRWLDVRQVVDLPVVITDRCKDVMDGKKLDLDCTAERVLLENAGELLAVYERDGSGRYRSVRGLW